jgi:hypothetical protein
MPDRSQTETVRRREKASFSIPGSSSPNTYSCLQVRCHNIMHSIEWKAGYIPNFSDDEHYI